MSKCDIALIGLAVMGENLVLNMESKGFSVAVFNRTVSKVDEFIGRNPGKNLKGCHSLQELVDSLQSPRKIMMMVKAGPAVDALIEELIPLLSPGDILIDGGNTHFADTNRRTKRIEEAGLQFIGTVFYHGGYVEALYFLTGEHREYNRKTGAFERVTPLQNAFITRTDCGPCAGWGGWQAGFRYNYLDLNDQGINGGILNDYTWGLNWFLNPNMKVQWNYSLTHRQSPVAAAFDGWNQGFGMRLAHDF